MLGIPGMFADIRRQIGTDAQLLQEYSLHMDKLVTLMQEKGSSLKRLADFTQYSRFHDAKHDQQQLAEDLHRHFSQQCPSALPIC